MTTACAGRQGDVAAYLLGTLDAPERDQLDAHLTHCASCRAELADLGAMPALLRRVPVANVARGPVQPDGAFLDRILRAAAVNRRRRQHRWLAAAAAVVIAGGVAGGVAATAAGQADHTTYQAVDAATGVRGEVVLHPQSTGTAVAVSVSGVHAAQRCVLVAIARDGRHDIAGTWQAGYNGTAHVSGVTAIPEASLAALQVQSSDGRVLLTVAL